MLPSVSLKPVELNFLVYSAIFLMVLAAPNLADSTGAPTAGTPIMFTNAEAGEVINQINEALDKNDGIVPVSVGFMM